MIGQDHADSSGASEDTVHAAGADVAGRVTA